nr:hypothetical protein CFP56_50386 [Quercus suber]
MSRRARTVSWHGADVVPDGRHSISSDARFIREIVRIEQAGMEQLFFSRHGSGPSTVDRRAAAAEASHPVRGNSRRVGCHLAQLTPHLPPPSATASPHWTSVAGHSILDQAHSLGTPPALIDLCFLPPRLSIPPEFLAGLHCLPLLRAPPIECALSPPERVPDRVTSIETGPPEPAREQDAIGELA